MLRAWIGASSLCLGGGLIAPSVQERPAEAPVCLARCINRAENCTTGYTLIRVGRARRYIEGRSTMITIK